MELPLPIPNRAVKRASADNSYPSQDREDRSWPGKLCFFGGEMAIDAWYYLVLLWCHMNASATIKLNLPLGIRDNALYEAERIGISLQDFIRTLMSTYFSRSESIVAVSRDKILLNQANSDISNNAFTKVKSKAELAKYFSKFKS